jgi:Spy/CpxP family protein refolding chaperone
MRFWKFVFVGILLSLAVTARAASDTSATPYAGQERRDIKTLSAKDIDDLVNGRGWGFAKAAELNGLPGPAHVLELKDKINLSPKQTAEIEALFARMKEKAVPLGRKLVSQERQLNEAFSTRNITPEALNAQLTEIARTRGALRFVHLSTHLQTPKILSHRQIASYNRLRGYDLGGEGAHHRGH